jgi:hypothetical protein
VLYGPWITGHQPDYLNREKLTPIHADGVGSWDEVHQKANPGGGIAGGAKDSIMQFPRDANGRLYLNGAYDDTLVTQMKCKYTDEVQLCLGGAVVTPIDENGNTLPRVRRVAKAFVYSCKVVLSIRDYAKKQSDEFRRVKTLKNSGKWVVKRRPANTVYRNDVVSVLTGVGGGHETKTCGLWD